MQLTKRLAFRPLAGGALALIAAGLSVTPSAKSQDVLTWHNDVARTGQYLNETILTPSNVNSASFGRLFIVPVDGKVDAQPLYASAVTVPGKGIHNLLVVATEHDTAYAFDADTGAPIWSTRTLLAGEMPSDSRSCDDMVPEIGIMPTPVIDRTRGPNGAVYLIAMSKNGAGTYFQRLHALDLATGAELFGGPQNIQASYPGNGENSSGGYVIFDPGQYHSRPALLLLNGIVYVTWAGHCDVQPYTGWVMGYNASTLAQTTVLNIEPNGFQGGIWMSGAGPAVDGSGNIYLATGNGLFDTQLTNGFPSKGDYGNAFLKISTSGGLAVADYFEMDNELAENGTDTDLGSGGVLVLPDMIDASKTVRHLAVGGGKDGNLYLVSRDKMGGFTSGANQIYQEISGGLPGGIFSAPAYYNNLLYYGPIGGPILAFQFSQAMLSTAATAQTTNAFRFPGATPSISANQNTNGMVWAAENTVPAVLHAYDATTLQELYNSNQASGGRDQFGAGNKFITPTIAHGRVYVGTTTGVGAFGLFTAAPPAIVSLSPNSGVGPATFTVVISDVNGAGSLSQVSLLVNTTVNAAGACDVYYYPQGNQLYLRNDGGTAWLAPVLTPGVAGTVSNSQCTLNAGSSSVSTSGNSLTLKVALSFTSTFVGSEKLYLYAAGLGLNTGWVQEGTWTPTPSAEPPAIVSLSPNSGGGTPVTFTAVYSDPNRAADLNQATLLVNTGINAAGACEVYYNPQANQLYLRNDAGTAWLTPALTPGATGTVSNSQCTLNAGSSSVSVSGNNLTLNAALSFSGTFVSPKNVYLFAAELSGQNSGWVQKGTWTPNPSAGPPAIVSLLPNSGGGTPVTFTAVYSDPNGAGDLNQAMLLVNTGVSAAGACEVYYYPQGNQLYLRNDAGTAWLTPALTPGAAGSVSNSQCTLNAGSSSAGTGGINLTLNVALSFNTTFVSPKKVYLFAAGLSGQNSGWVQKGTWTPNPSAGPPTTVSLLPNSGGGTPVTFTAVYSDPNGAGDLNQAMLLVNTGVSAAGACEVYYYLQGNQLYLRNDAGTAWLTPALTPGAAGSVSNSQCTLNAGSSSVSTAGNNLSLNAALSFSSSFVTSKNVYLFTAGLSGQNSGWVQKGTWTPNPSAGPPVTVSLLPSSGAGTPVTFTAVYADPNGATDLNLVMLLVNTGVNAAGACEVYYYPQGNQLYLRNDAGTAWLGALAPGVAGTVSNGQCTLNAGSSSVTKAGNNLTLNVALSFSGTFVGPKNVYLFATGLSGQNSGWVQEGTWTP